MSSEIVISGIAGRYPESDNLDEFWKNLTDGVNMISEDNRRWNIDAYDMPRRMGKLRALDEFDADYFGVHGKQANAMDPKLRIGLELTQEALLDAGVNPGTVRGSRTGVFAAVTNEEAHAIWVRSNEDPSGYINLGCAFSMNANRVSFAFDFRGPSYAIDSACAAGSVALLNAYSSIQNGLCDAAIVLGCQLCLDPYTSLGFHKVGMTGMEGKCRVFDASAAGYVRAEAVVALYLCKKGQAKRSYATIVGAKCNNDGYKQEGITFPSGAAQEQLAREVYQGCGVSPLDVGYVEAHGTGTKAGDPEEMNAIAKVFCEGRTGGPLLVGSVKSNMGHSEAASGLCGITKVLLAHCAGILPPNLHFETPNPGIPALVDGRVKVITKPTAFNERYAAVNSFGFGGTNVHVLLELTPKAEASHSDPSIPVLLPVSGRTSEAVEHLLGKSWSHANNRNAAALLHEVFRGNIPRYRYRGYALIAGTKKPEFHVDDNPCSTSRPIWFIFSGLGSQWTGMGRDLIKFETFQQSILKSAETLKTYDNYDLLGFLNSGDPEALLDLKNCIVSITVIQVALVDLLATIGVVPDGIVGHSTGECASAYADGSFTHEQAILVSLGRARAFLESKLPAGTVAAVGLSWKEATRRCPPGIFPAIHNSKDNVTVAGPPEPLRSFVKQLKSEGIPATEIQSAVFGFHSPYVKDSEKLMREFLSKVIPEPKARSGKWLSSSLPADMWDTELGKYSSVDYHVNNALSPVYFYETLLHIPEDAIVLEIGPHCFMQSILKQALPATTAKLGLMSKHTDDNASYFLNALGKLHLEGCNLDVSKLYDPVEFPVGPETPIISPWIKWDHGQSWDVPNVENEISKGGGSKFTFDLTKELHSFYEGHSIDGRIIFPGTGYICCVWKAFAQTKGMNFEKLPVVFEQLRFERSTLLGAQKPTELVVNILSDVGEFEITDGGVGVFRGRIRTVAATASIQDEMFDTFPGGIPHEQNEKLLIKADCYKELRLRGYEYTGVFQGIRSVSMDGDQALLEWHDNWISFLDTILQASIVSKPHRDLYMPIRIEKVTIDPQAFKSHLGSETELVSLTISKTLETSQCPGIEVRGIKVAMAPRRVNRTVPNVTEHKFLPYFDEELHSFQAALDFCLSIVMDNTGGKTFILTEQFTLPQWESISTSVVSHCVARFAKPECRLVVSLDLTSGPHNCPTISKLMSTTEIQSLDPCNLLYSDTVPGTGGWDGSIAAKGFLLLKDASSGISPDPTGFIRVGLKHTGNCKLILYRAISNLAPIACFLTIDSKDDYSWVDTLKEKLVSDANQRIVLVSQSTTGLTGLVKSLIREGSGVNIRGISVEYGDFGVKLSQESMQSLLKNDLVLNVLQNGTWGCYGNFVIPMHDLAKPQNVSDAYANVLTTGDLSSLQWIESPLRAAGAEDVVCQISHSALNFRDIMLATGKLSRDALPGDAAFDDCVLGLEYSGVCDSKRVMGLCPSKCLATKVVVDPSFMWEIPKSWSFEEAATVPAVYATAIYALVVRGNMRPGESVLIHAGSGGVGQAAITVALDLGCTVFTTVGTKEKREFLKARFPQLRDENITDSRNARIFEKHVKEQTQGRGVDIVLNSLAQDKLHASIRCLAKYGRFLEIGKFDLFEDTNVGLSVLLKSVNIQGILLDDVMQGNPETKDKIVALVQEGINSGMIQPLPFTSFGHDQLEEAFRFMASGKHMGKVLIKTATNDIPSLPRTYFFPHKSYVLIGGLGGMGLEIANWMIDRGCRKIVLNSRAGIRNSYQQYRIEIFRKKGVSVVVDQSDASHPEGAHSLLDIAIKLGPIGGIFNLALVLQDALFENQSPDSFNTVSKGKVLATMELDRDSRKLAPELDHFVVFSSIVAARGNPGQTSYGFANSFMERICEQRRREGLPAMAIQWGLIDDVGVAFENSVVERQSQAFGMASQRMSSWLPTLDIFLRQGTRTILSSFIPHDASTESGPDSSRSSLASGVAHILGIKDISKINRQFSLFDLGMDSMMATEIKQLLDAKVGDISSFAPTHGQLTFAQILAMEGNASAESKTERKQTLYPFPQETIRKLKSAEQTQDVIFLVHPVDGSLSSLELLVSHLDATVYGIEGTRKAPLDSVEVLARFYIQAMKDVQPNGPYKLAGYSFGGAIAFEMALQLEEEGSVVDSLLFLDGCPKWKNIFKGFAVLKDLSVDVNTTLLHFVTSHSNLNSGDVEKDIVALSSWDERVNFVAKLLKNLYSSFDVEEIKDLAKAFSDRFLIAFNYEPTKRIKCQTMLVKCVEGLLEKHMAIGHDYGINENCHSRVKIVNIQGTHHSFIVEPLELGIPGIINQMYRNE